MSNKNQLLIFRANPDKARELAESLQSETIEPIVVESSEKLRETLNFQRVDFLVMDNDLPGFLTGVEMLERIFNDLLRPGTILLAKPNADLTKKAEKIGVNIVLEPDSEPARILESVQHALTTRGGADLFIPALARQIVKENGDIGPLPQVVAKLASHLVNQMDLSLEELAADISVDAKITGDLLALINSAAMGLQRKVTRVFDAINFLGVRQVITLILSSSVIRTQKYLCQQQQMSQADRMWYNKRSVLIASTAYTFADKLGNVAPDTAFVLGLFQDLGILLMANAFPSRYMDAVNRVRSKGPLRLEVVEDSQFNITHGQVSAALLQKWGLPHTMITPVLDHHSPDRFDVKPKVEQEYLYAMQIGEALANVADGHAPHRLPRLNDLMARYGKNRAQDCKMALQLAVAKAVDSGELFQVPIPDPAEFQSMVKEVVAQLQE